MISVLKQKLSAVIFGYRHFVHRKIRVRKTRILERTIITDYSIGAQSSPQTAVSEVHGKVNYRKSIKLAYRKSSLTRIAVPSTYLSNHGVSGSDDPIDLNASFDAGLQVFDE